MFPATTLINNHHGLALSAIRACTSISLLIRGGQGGRSFLTALAAHGTHGGDSPRARTTAGTSMHTTPSRRAAPARPLFPAPLCFQEGARTRLSVGGCAVLSFFCKGCLKIKQTDRGSFLASFKAGNSNPFCRVVSGAGSY